MAMLDRGRLEPTSLALARDAGGRPNRGTTHPYYPPRDCGKDASEAEHPRAQMRTTSGPTPGGYLRFAPDGLRLWQWKSCGLLKRDFPTEMSDD